MSVSIELRMSGPGTERHWGGREGWMHGEHWNNASTCRDISGRGWLQSAVKFGVFWSGSGVRTFNCALEVTRTLVENLSRSPRESSLILPPHP